MNDVGSWLGVIAISWIFGWIVSNLLFEAKDL